MLCGQSAPRSHAILFRQNLRKLSLPQGHPTLKKGIQKMEQFVEQLPTTCWSDVNTVLTSNLDTVLQIRTNLRASIPFWIHTYKILDGLP